MTNRLRASGIILLPYLLLAAGCNRLPPIRPYDRPLEGEVTPAEAEPLVIVGIAEGDEKIGKLVASPVSPGTRLQLHRVAVHIENVLRGSIPEHDIALYYFAFQYLNTAHPPLIFGKAPSRRLIVLRKDGGVYRAVLDGWNCAPRIVTGAHPGYKPDPNSSAIQYEVELNLARGEGPVDDAEFAEEVKMCAGYGPEGTAIEKHTTTEKLAHLALTESGKVKSAACVALWNYSEWRMDESVRKQARDAMKAAGCKCGGSGFSVVCQ
jgi:hypothetical protein